MRRNPSPLKRAARKVARAGLGPKQQAYDWLTRGAIRRDFDEIALRASGYPIQCGQDKWIIESMLPARKEGVFVDIGANDGVTLSNTLVLEKDHGWTGIAVEPIPEVFARLQANRICTVGNGCVGEG